MSRGSDGAKPFRSTPYCMWDADEARQREDGIAALDGRKAESFRAPLGWNDGQNRLIAVDPVIPASGDKKQLNAYDAQSRRVRKQVFTYASGTWNLTTDEKFIYDGWNVVAVFEISNAQFVMKQSFTWGLDLSGSLQGAGGVGGLLSAKDSGSVYHYTYDANGNVSGVLNGSGDIAAHYEYDAFGNTVASSGTYATTNAYRFSTKPLDSVSELYYYGLRYYIPSTGRWPSRDPIQERGGMNLYGFVLNNPFRWVDRLGLDPATAAVVAGGSSAAWGGGVSGSTALANAGISTGVGLGTSVGAVGAGTLAAAGTAAFAAGYGVGTLADNTFGISDALSGAISNLLGYEQSSPRITPYPDTQEYQEFQRCNDSCRSICDAARRRQCYIDCMNRYAPTKPPRQQ